MGLWKLSLVERAQHNLARGYAPYSNGYRVGAALIAASGRIYDGANIEMCIHRATHAERVAIDQAVFHGEREFKAIAVVTDDLSDSPSYPCGQCLQDLTEFDVDRSGRLIIIAGNLLGVVRESTLDRLLPERFGPANLGIKVRDW